LSCDPVYADWGAEGEIQISDDAIVPNAAYLLKAIDGICAISAEGNYSAGLQVMTTALWGDLIGPGGPAPDGNVNVLDIAVVVNKLKELPGAPSTPQADLYPGIPDQVVNVLDIVLVVDALKGFAFPFTGPGGCP
jgi:hypothetical protein